MQYPDGIRMQYPDGIRMQHPDGIRMQHPDPASSQHNLYDIYLLLCIQYWTPDDGQKTCPKHVEFYSKINLRN